MPLSLSSVLRFLALVGTLTWTGCLSAPTDESLSDQGTSSTGLGPRCTAVECVITEGVVAVEAARSGLDSGRVVLLGETELHFGDTLVLEASFSSPPEHPGSTPVVELLGASDQLLGVLQPSPGVVATAFVIADWGNRTVRIVLRRDGQLSAGGRLSVLQHTIFPPVKVWRRFPVSSEGVGFLAAPGTSSCGFRAPITVCGVTVGISPYYPFSDHGPDNWQSGSGTGQSTNISVTLSAPVDSFTIVVWDSDVSGNRVVAYSSTGVVLADIPVPYDGVPNSQTTDTVRIGASGIARVSLVAVTGDYISYSGGGFYRTCSGLNDALANDTAFQNFARSLLASSLAAADTVETVGSAFIDPTSGQLSFAEDFAAVGTACSVTGQLPADTPTQVLVAWVHTHPWVPGRLLVCGPNLDIVRYRFVEGLRRWLFPLGC